MSEESEQQRRPGAPDDTDGKRRLRAVSYPDPYLVTKLPLEGTVNSGVIRLGEKMLLGFIHRPYPDGTRVRVVYDEWLFAERVEEGSGGGERETKEPSEKGGGGRAKDGSRKGTGKGRTTGAGAAKRAAAKEAKGAAKAGAKGPEAGEEQGDRHADPEADVSQADRGPFPEEFSDPERTARGDRIGGGDAWTDAFGNDDRND